MKLHRWPWAMRSIWTLQCLDPQDPGFNTGQYTDLYGAIDQERFEAASRYVISHCESLRSRIYEDQGETLLKAEPLSNWVLNKVDLSQARNPIESALQYMQFELARVFEVAAPLFSWTLLRLAERHFIWSFIAHQITLDGFARNAIAKQLAQTYSLMINGQEVPDFDVASLKDVFRQDLVYRSSKEFLLDQEYWKRQTRNLPETPTLSRRSPTKSFRARRGVESLPCGRAALLKAAARSGTTLTTLICAAAALYQHRITGEADIVIGLQVSGRTGPHSRRSLGCMSNIVPLRISIDASCTLEDLLIQIRVLIRNALKHSRFPLADLRSSLGLSPVTDRLFAIVVNVLNFDYALKFGPIPSKTHYLSNGPVADLSINIADDSHSDELEISVCGNTDLYTDNEVAQHRVRLAQIICEMSRVDSHRLVRSIPWLTRLERRQLIHGFNQTAVALESCTLADLFQRQVQKTPGAIALFFGGRSFTYSALDAAANRLARHLFSYGVGSESVVAVLAERSSQLTIALLAIWKCGAAYLPLDPGHPPARSAYMLRDCGVQLLLADEEPLEALKEWEQEAAGSLGGDSYVHLRRLPPAIVVDLDSLKPLLDAYSDLPIEESERTQPLIPEALAYVIYTSGSTGVPKGVEVNHSAVCNRLLWMAKNFPICEGTRFLHKTPIAFDVSVWEWFMPLICGGVLVVAKANGHKDPGYLCEIIRQYKIEVLHFVPSMLTAFLAHKDAPRCESLALIITSGEALSGDLQERCLRILPKANLWNLYGPTEAAIEVSAWHCRQDDGRSTPPIGMPIQNVQLYVLDKYFEPVPVDSVGELFIAGACLARGYRGRPDFTASSFLACPFGPPGSRMYRTGDLVRWRADGALEFLGRVDQQIKINGNRIEPGEIETSLLKIDSIAASAVVPREVEGKTRLVAYIVNRPGKKAVDHAEILALLANELPDYMWPSAFVNLAELPLNSNGKLDRSQLPDADLLFQPESSATVFGPNEQLLCDLFARVLGKSAVSPDNDFFRIGGRFIACGMPSVGT